jgi:ferredoxin-type protein NapH
MEDTESVVEGKKSREPARRQKIRKALIYISFLLFPVTFYYLSPYLIMRGTSEGIIDGSFIFFILLFLFALVLGRGFCGWVCPAGGMQELCFKIRDKRARGGRWNWIKYFIWVPWISIIVIMAIRSGGYSKVDPSYQTFYGISVSDIPSLMTMFFVLVMIAIVALASGKRGFCHYACWMAPFMILGRKLRNLFGWPSLQLESDEDKCTDCKKCIKVCPMSLDVNGMVKTGSMENTECILCGMCIDNCPMEVISYSFNSRQRS